MKQYDEYELKLIEWLKNNFKNRYEFSLMNFNLYYKILKNYTNIIDEALPSYFNLSKSFQEMINLLPEGVTFVEGQIWTGAKKRYKFLCSNYGEFYGVPFKLRQRTWNKGLTGHPEDAKRYLYNTAKKVLCIETKVKYPSARFASSKLNVPASSIIKVCKGRQKSTGGYTFKYVEDEDV